MDFNLGMAVLAGLVGTVALTVVMYMGSAMMGIKMDMPMTLGTMLFRRSAAAWVAGLMMHLMMGIVFFIVYAALISAFGMSEGIVGWTAVFGAVHGFMAGGAFGMMSAVHPRLAANPSSAPGSVQAPGYWGIKLGKIAPLAIIMVHVVYGLAGGLVYAA